MRGRLIKSPLAPTGLIDVHSHILPGADDGSRDWDETKKLLELSYEQGFRKILLTPHYVNHQNRMTADEILQQTGRLQKLAGEMFPDMDIYPGQEILFFGGIVEALLSGQALTLADTNYVLIEFSPSAAYTELFQAVRTLTFERYSPVLAHVERYKCLRRPGRIEELIHSGAYMQMNYKSLSGWRRLSDRNWCRKTVLSGKIHFLGTDMHRIDYRPPESKEAVKWLRKKRTLGLLERLAVENPARLLAGENV